MNVVKGFDSEYTDFNATNKSTGVWSESATEQYNLGVKYYKGQGVQKDYKQAVHWFRKAAEQGHIQAQDYLGVMYHNGQGVPKDDKQAVYWNQKGADQGDANAQYNLAFMYREGLCVRPD